MLSAAARVPRGLQPTSPAPCSQCRGCTCRGLHPAACSANWQVTMPGLCPCPMMLPVIYRSFYSSCKEAVNYRRSIN